jgi:hypothetical protein
VTQYVALLPVFCTCAFNLPPQTGDLLLIGSLVAYYNFSDIILNGMWLYSIGTVQIITTKLQLIGMQIPEKCKENFDVSS